MAEATTGRLFWKIFAGFWLALIAAAIGVGISVHLEQQARFERWVSQYEAASVALGPVARARVDDVASLLRHAGPETTAAVLAERGHHPQRRPVLVVDPLGRELLGRPVPRTALDEARELADGPARGNGAAARVRAPDGREYLLFSVPANRPAPGAEALRHPPRFTQQHAASPWVLVAAGVLASLAFSAGLAWYMARPIRLIRGAVQRVAQGQLDTRVVPALAGRRDELADLGRDVDAMTARLQSLLDAQRRLLHDVSHELRSPLARLQAAVGIAQQAPERAVTMLDRIERESQRLDTLVGEVLELARLESGRDLDAPTPTDLGALLSGIAEDARFEAAPLERRIELRCRDDEMMLPARIELLHRAFDNVVRNALHHTAPGTAVEIEASGRDGDWIVTVADRGPGLDGSELTRVFEPFARGGRTPDREGFGLGLAIARRAIEAHGGRIEAEPRPGGGLVMRVTLPAG